jgi:hypothetical protein
MGSTLPTVSTLRGKRNKKEEKEKRKYCPNITRKVQKFTTHDRKDTKGRTPGKVKPMSKMQKL